LASDDNLKKRIAFVQLDKKKPGWLEKFLSVAGG